MPLSRMGWREASILKAISNPNIKSFFQAALAKTVFDRKKTPHCSTFIDVKAKPFPKLHKRIPTTNEIIFECSCYIFQDTQNWRIQHWEELTNISLLCHDARTDMNVEVKTSGILHWCLSTRLGEKRQHMSELFPFHRKSLIPPISFPHKCP